MIVVIDRFEGEFAIVETETEKLINMPKALIPKKAKEGSVISIELNEQKTKERQEKISKLMNRVWDN